MSTTVKTVAFIAARAGTGKTTLMEAVIARLKEKGYRVGAVKHAGHEAAVDREGSDSWRFKRAGTHVTVLAAEGQLAVIRSLENPTFEDALTEASAGTDIVLLEGFKEMPVPKIEVYRSGHSEKLYCRGEGEPDPHLVAVASDVSLDLDVPILDLNDPDGVCEFIVKRFITNH